MNIIFLDFNGVLDTFDDMDVIDIANLERLKYLVLKTNSKVVISSSIVNNFYRTHSIKGILKYLIDTLNENGIEVIGLLDYYTNREDAIINYLSRHPFITNYCILDDDYYMPKLVDNLVKLPLQSDGSTGLTDKDVKKSIKILLK